MLSTRWREYGRVFRLLVGQASRLSFWTGKPAPDLIRGCLSHSCRPMTGIPRYRGTGRYRINDRCKPHPTRRMS